MIELNDIPVIGEAGPHVTGIDVPFWEGLAAGEVRMQRCAGCGVWSWPPQWRCGECGSWEMVWEAVALKGRVFSWIRTHYPFVPEMRDHMPFVTLLVELPQAGGRRLFGMLIGNEDGLRIGASVEGIIQHYKDSPSVLRWRLTGVGEGAA